MPRRLIVLVCAAAISMLACRPTPNQLNRATRAMLKALRNSSDEAATVAAKVGSHGNIFSQSERELTEYLAQRPDLLQRVEMVARERVRKAAIGEIEKRIAESKLTEDQKMAASLGVSSVEQSGAEVTAGRLRAEIEHAIGRGIAAEVPVTELTVGAGVTALALAEKPIRDFNYYWRTRAVPSCELLVSGKPQPLFCREKNSTIRVVSPSGQ